MVMLIAKHKGIINNNDNPEAKNFLEFSLLKIP